MNRNGPVRLVVVLSISTAMLGACTRQPEPNEVTLDDAVTTVPPADDVEVSTSVQARLYASEDARGRNIDVSTNKGVVTLSGSVESEAARERAITIARETEGVTRVDDQLMVRAAAQQRAEAERTPDNTAATTGTDAERQASPGWITTKIQAQYFVDPEIKPWNIDVTTVGGGVVTLSGEVDSAEDKAQAVQIARSTEGVTRVVDNLRVGGERPEAREGSGADPAPEGSIADAIRDQFSDPWLTTKVRSKYFLDPDVRGLAIDVTTQNGTVTLRGDVESEAERRQAIAIARNTDGVRDVRDELRLRPESDRARTEDPVQPRAIANNAAEAAGDTWITTKIQAKYFLDADVKGHEINVDTRNGVVTLNGSVESNAAIQAAEQIAEETDGVSRVVNRLTVESAQAR